MTIIEIREDADDLHSFFEVDENYQIEDLCDIFILQFPAAKEASISYGKIEKKSDLYIFYSASTLPGSSGGAVLNRKNYKVIGLHKGSSKQYNIGIIIEKGINSLINRNSNYNRYNNHEHYFIEDSGWICFCDNCRKGFLHFSGYSCTICKRIFCKECYRTKAKIEWGPLNHIHPLEKKAPLWFKCERCKERWYPFYMEKYLGFYCSICDKYFCWVCYFDY